MIYAHFNEAGRVETLINDSTVSELPPGGHELTEEQAGSRFDLLLVAGNIELSPLEPNLTDLQAKKSALIDKQCRDCIYAGFASSALGAVHHYPAKDKDQANLVASVTESLYPALEEGWATPFWCAVGSSAGEWAFRSHTAIQIQQVGRDGKAAILTALATNAQLQEQIAASKSSEELAAIVWPQ
jgi:hypothetical protein